MSFDLVCLLINIAFTLALVLSFINQIITIRKSKKLLEDIKRQEKEFWESFNQDV